MRRNAEEVEGGKGEHGVWGRHVVSQLIISLCNKGMQRVQSGEGLVKRVRII